MEETNKRQIRFDLKKKIVMLGVLPVLVLGLMVIFIAQTIVRDSLLKEIKDALQSAATSTFAVYDQNSGDILRRKMEKYGKEATIFPSRKALWTVSKKRQG